jgi:transcriptional regulator with XRE-family HTH domain
MSNERLRKAMANARVSVEDVAEAAEVNPKTVQRWLSGRLPYARHRWAVAKLLQEDEAFLWPEAETAIAPGEQSTAEVVAAYAHRADLPAEHWRELMLGARREIDLLGYALLYLPEANPRMTDVLSNKAAHGCRIRVALVDPDSPEAAQRDAEEQLAGGLLARIRTSLRYFSGLRNCDGAEVHLHRTAMYATVLRFDEEMIVTPHLYGRPGYQSPLLRLRHLGAGGIFDTYATHFEDVWATSTPVQEWP